MKFKKIVSYIIIINLCFILSACKNGMSDKALQKIFIENGYSLSDIEDLKVVKVINLENDIEGLDNSDDNKLVLVSKDDKYANVIVNTETRTVIDTVMGFAPLNAVSDEIQCADADTNIKNCIIYAKYLKKYGVDCLKNIEYATEFLREISGKDGVIDTEKARKAISNSTADIFPNINSADDVTVLFEENNAVPMYYIGAETEMVYNWWSLWPEYQYEMVKASLDRSTLSRIAAIYGQPYVMQTVWVALDKNLKKQGTYDSLEDAKNKLQNTNKSKSGTTIVYKINSSDTKTDFIDVSKEVIASRLKDMGYDSAEINIKDSDKIEVIISPQDNIEAIAKMLISGTNLQFTDHNKNVLLTDEDIQKATAEQDTENNSYYILLKFTKGGKAKFKKATSEIAKLAAPDNQIDIAVDGAVISTPTVTQKINSDSCTISGNFSSEEAEKIKNMINFAINNKDSIEVLETR